jgi:hypothetical protein
VRIKYLSNKNRVATNGDAISYQVFVEQGVWIDMGTCGALQTPIETARLFLESDYGRRQGKLNASMVCFVKF